MKSFIIDGERLFLIKKRCISMCLGVFVLNSTLTRDLMGLLIILNMSSFSSK